MKHFLFLLAVVSVIACGHPSVKETQKIDTVAILARGVDNSLFIDSAIRITGLAFARKDSNSLDGSLVDYTFYRIGHPTDTIKDSAHHPIAIHLTYDIQPVDSSYNVYIHLITIPKRKIISSK